DLAENEAAQAAARGHTLRTSLLVGRAMLRPNEGIPRRGTKILEQYRLGRRGYTPPHQNLIKKEAASWTQVQTNTFPHGTLFHLIQPTCYEYDCKKSKVPSNLYHMVWECQGNTAVPPIQGPTPEQWEDLLTMRKPCNPDDRIKLIDRARRTAEDHGFLD
ncbi:hypothetical protein HPB47_027631, partial [Ixodes persulcatus]